MKPTPKNSDRVKRFFYIDIERATTLTLLALLGLMLWAMLT